MTRIIKNVWPKKKNISNLQIAWMISITKIIFNSNNKNIKISEEIIKLVLLKNLNKVKNESFKYKSNFSERLKKVFKRLAAFKKSAVPERPTVPKNEENNGDDDKTDKTDKTY
ncbi:hypothetical protein Glove_515g7 [Diversispora epigaea]|uniref:Uncharacterized protein n=1 Tax=Diversispora epigaea TaxID=1348612 RepID=A0A397GFM7_9GLOM|nr:hypothetical protein Glove_515g7 [Diversispora epigaea]